MACSNSGTLGLVPGSIKAAISLGHGRWDIVDLKMCCISVSIYHVVHHEPVDTHRQDVTDLPHQYSQPSKMEHAYARKLWLKAHYDLRIMSARPNLRSPVRESILAQLRRRWRRCEHKASNSGGRRFYFHTRRSDKRVLKLQSLAAMSFFDQFPSPKSLPLDTSDHLPSCYIITCNVQLEISRL